MVRFLYVEHDSYDSQEICQPPQKKIKLIDTVHSEQKEVKMDGPVNVELNITRV